MLDVNIPFHVGASATLDGLDRGDTVLFPYVSELTSITMQLC